MANDEWRITFCPEEWRYAEERRDRRAEFTIFRVPKTLLKENEEAYLPQMISLGPFHFLTSEDFKATETDKRETARHYMGELPNDFLQPLELIGEGKASLLPSDNFFSQVMTKGRPVFIDIIKDFLKLENQVPLVLLEALHRHIYADPKISFDNFLLNKCRCLLPFVIDEGDVLSFKGMEKGDHLLGCIRELLVGIKPQNNVVRVLRSSILKQYWGRLYSAILGHCWELEKHHLFCCKQLGPRGRRYLLLPSAVQLNKAGIKFKAFSDGGGIRNIRFDSRTFILHLPEIRVDILTETIMRNVIAFELYSSACKEKEVTSYAHLMNDLIDTKEDVALLRKSGIIFQGLGSDKEVAKLWNALSKSTSRPYVRQVFQATSDMKDAYQRRRLRILWSEFKEAYFWKPWIFASAMAATLVLGMTVVQFFCLFHKCQ